MTEIIKRGREHCAYPIGQKAPEEVLTFACSSCGCVFQTDEYNTISERCLNGKTWYRGRVCPWCGSRDPEDLIPASVYAIINGTCTPVNPDGSFSHEIHLNEGDNLISAVIDLED